MIFDVLVYKIITNYSGSWPSDMGSHTLSADNYLHVVLDDSTETLAVRYQSSPLEGINILGTLTSGPNLFFGFDGAVQLLTSIPYYQWCDSTTLKKINVLNNFPYSYISAHPDALECAIAPTCDLEISSLYSITEASGPATADGAITISATSSNGTIKFSLDPDFDYATAGQTSGTFSGLLPDDYTIYAKDVIGCLDNISFTIPVTTAYGVRHRLDFTDLHAISQKAIRVDIEERAYEGDILEMCGFGKSPVKVKYQGDRDEANTPLVPSGLTIDILVETEGQYTHLHTADDRQFRTKVYTGDDFLSLELYHVGYIIPELHHEPYLFPPYGMTVTSSDQLGEMKNLPFLDVNENKFKGDLKLIKVLAEILKKTDIAIPIRCAINVFEENMDTDPEDDPLDQVYLDSRIYYSEKNVPVKCNEVLESIAEPFRATIFQSMGYWWILRLSESCGSIVYREFDVNGDYVDDDTLDPVVEIDFPTAIRAGSGAMFAERSQILSFLQNFGSFSITHDLKKDGNLIDEGRFESEDIIDLGSGNQTFKNWNYLVGQPGTTFGFEAVVNGDSLGAAFVDFTLSNNPQADNVWYSNVIPMDDFGAYRLKFQYLITAKYNAPYIRLAWGLKFHTVSDSYIWLTTAANGALQYELTEQRNEIYATKYGEWQNFEIYHTLSQEIPTDYVQIFLYSHNHYGRDFADETELRAFSLRSQENPLGFRRMMAGDTGETNVYIGEYSNDADDFPNVVRPDDYNTGSGSRDWLWRLDKVLNIGPNVGLITRTKFDNLSLAFYPLVFTPVSAYVEPQETFIYSEVVDQFVKSTFEKTVLLGDMIRYNDEFTRNEKNLYRSYLRYEDGTPTRFWARSGVDESKNILQILLEDYIAQFSEPPRRLSGIKITNRIVHFINCFQDNIDSVRYRPLTFEFDAANAIYTPDMAGVTTGGDGGPYAPGAFDAQGFSSGFLIGS